MMHPEILLLRLAEEGATLVLAGDELRIVGQSRPSASLMEEVRAQAPVLKERIRLARREAEPGEDHWERCRILAGSLGRRVTLHGRDCLLWGLNAHGCQVFDGAAILLVDPTELGTQ